MIKFDKFFFGFPEKDLYEDVNLEIETGDHLVLIGSNGSGKSSLINLILHEEKYTYEGLIRMNRDMRIGYVSQFVEHETSEGSVFDILAAPFKELLQKNDDLCVKMGNAEADMDAVYAEYQKVMDQIDAIDAYNYESNIGKELAAAGLSALQDRQISQLSGGEYKLLFIMRNMLLSPELLIMDEPDVFLDFENLIALINLINSYKGTLLTVTHNRLLLTQCFDKVWNIENKSIIEFPGTFPEYEKWMLENKIEIFERARNFDEFIKQQEEVAKKVRHIAEMTAEAHYGRQLKARASYIERLNKMRGDDPFLEEHKHEFHLAFGNPLTETSSESDHNKSDEDAWFEDHVDLADASDAEKQIEASPIEVRNYTLQYEDDDALLTDVSFTVAPGEKVVLVGTNGTGKSSMLRDISRMLEEKNPGQFGYFKQIVESDESLKLSGGERNLARIEELCTNPHTGLLLDEPTSHLDIYAQIELEKAIRDYPGTVLMVSHDLFAITGCADRIIMIEDNQLREVSGRAYRKSIYKKYFASDIFDAEKQRIDTEIRVTNLIHAGKYEEARKALGFPKADK